MWILNELRDRKRYYLVVGALALLGGVALAFLQTGREAPSPVQESYEAPGYTVMGSSDVTSGTELLMVYIGAAECAWSNRDSVPVAVSAVKEQLVATAEEEGHTFATLGVALDWSVEEGLDHLDRTARFDEVAAGRNWLNTGAVRYIWKDVPGQAATPQILVLKREVSGPTGDSPRSRYEVGDPELVVRKVGYPAILRWAEQDAPLPREEDGTIAAGGQGR